MIKADFCFSLRIFGLALPPTTSEVATLYCRTGPRADLKDRLSRAMAKLDRYEGQQYRREQLIARDGAGRAIRALAYMWRSNIPPGARSIPEGDFLAWLQRTGARAFS